MNWHDGLVLTLQLCGGRFKPWLRQNNFCFTKLYSFGKEVKRRRKT